MEDSERLDSELLDRDRLVEGNLEEGRVEGSAGVRQDVCATPLADGGITGGGGIGRKKLAVLVRELEKHRASLKSLRRCPQPKARGVGQGKEWEEAETRSGGGVSTYWGGTGGG